MRPDRPLRPGRALILIVLALVAGLVVDWLRRDRVVFPRPLPRITTEAAP